MRLVIRMPASGMCLVMSNESRLWDILSNLVSNALKFSTEERRPWVLVRPRRQSGRWSVVVQDNGIGIPIEEGERIFEEYFRVSGLERSRRDGQGLGLAIVREATARLQGHSIRFFSQAGKGTRFVLDVPAATGGPIAAIDGPESASLGPSSVERSGRGSLVRTADESFCPVLLVEDDEVMSQALSRSLERWGYSVRLASTGEEAIALVVDAQELLVAIISDFRLSGGWDGLRLIEHLRTLEGQRTPAIILTGEFRVETLRLDAPEDVRILSKPPDVANLRAFLEEARLMELTRPTQAP